MIEVFLLTLASISFSQPNNSLARGCSMKEPHGSVPTRQWTDFFADRRLTTDPDSLNYAISSVETFAKGGAWTGTFSRRSQVIVKGRWKIEKNQLFVTIDKSTFCRLIDEHSAEDKIILIGEQPSAAKQTRAKYIVSHLK